MPSVKLPWKLHLIFAVFASSTLSTVFSLVGFLPSRSDRDHTVANVFGPKSIVDISWVKYPATLVLIGGLDILIDWQRKYYDGLRRGGKEVDLSSHSSPRTPLTFFDRPLASELGI